MAKFKVYGSVQIGVCLTVEAESAGDAINVASFEWPGLDDYAGNGATHGKLIGTSESNLRVETDGSEPVFTEAEKVGG